MYFNFQINYYYQKHDLHHKNRAKTYTNEHLNHINYLLILIFYIFYGEIEPINCSCIIN